MREEPGDLSALMRDAISGNDDSYRRALGLMVVLLRGYVRRGLTRYGYGTDDVEDVVQEGLLAIHLKRQTWDPGQPVEPWAYAIARNKLIDHLRRRGRRVHIPIDDVVDTLEAPQVQDSIEARDRDALIATLKPAQRDLLRAISVDGLSAREAGVRFNMSEGAVRVALHRALKALAARHRSQS